MPREPRTRPSLAPGRVVWITGASSGIGRATAHACAERGDRLVLTSRAAGVLEQVAVECRAAGALDVVVAPADITDDAAVAAALDAALGRFGRLDVVVQCAGVAAYGRVEDLPADVFDAVVTTNVLGAARVARAAVRTFRAQGSGTLVVVGSVLGRIAVPYMGAYITSKFALRGLVRVLQQEVRGSGVDVVLIAPGGVDTPIYDQSATVMGRRNQPPPPVASPQDAAAKVLHAVEHPHREVDVGWGNPFMKLAFALAPGLFDALARPAMLTLGFARGKRPDGPGNVLAPRPEAEQLHQAPGGRRKGS